MHRLGCGIAVCLGLLLASVRPALAHDPIILTPEQTDPAAGPLLPDGTISFALYGVLDGAGDTRGFTARFAAGDRLQLTLLIPDLEPESAMAPEQLPRLLLTAPDGVVSELLADERVEFDESFSQTSYLRLLTVDENAVAGEYGITVTADVALRFVVAIGAVEQFGTPVERVPNRDDRAAGSAGVQTWYDTPPGSGDGGDGGDGGGSGVDDWLAPLVIGTVAGALALVVGVYYGFVRPGRTR